MLKREPLILRKKGAALLRLSSLLIMESRNSSLSKSEKQEIKFHANRLADLGKHLRALGKRD